MDMDNNKKESEKFKKIDDFKSNFRFEWLKDNILRQKKIIAVSGTHGKTTIASLMAFILKDLGMDPGYLIGGIPTGFDHSSNIGTDPFFIVEADEYDTAFFDKRSKFIHYKPHVLVINNIEFDHVDIFNDICIRHMV